MLKNVSIRILEDSRFLRFFAHNWPFGKNISFLASLVKVFSVGRTGYSWYPKVCWVLKNASMPILEDSRCLQFFAHLWENLIFGKFG